MTLWPPSDELPDDLLHRYLAGEATAAQIEAIETWMQQAPGRREAIDALRQGLCEPSPTTTSGNIEQAVAGVMAASGLADTRTTFRAPWAPASRYRWTTAGAMAAVLLGLGGVWLGRHAMPFQREHTYATVAGQRMQVTLIDGTRVALGPESRLRLASGYAHGARDVALEGEAYFAVVHDTRHPFAVLADNLRITDVGTEFDVRAYDADIRVAVAQGAVTVGAGRGTARLFGGSRTRPSFPTGSLPPFPGSRTRPSFPTEMLHAGDVATTHPSFPTDYSPSLQDIPLSAGDMAEVINGVSTVTHHVDMASLVAWTQGALVFQDTPLPDVIRQLERTFDVSITLSDSLLAREAVTVSLSHPTLDEVLDIVTHVIGANYHRSGHTVVIQRRTSLDAPTPAHPQAPLTTVNATHD